MIKFLLSLPLAIFIILEAFIVYQLGNVLFRATNENVAGLVGDWSFFQIVLALVGIIIGIVLATFLYITVVLKPIFYPVLEEDKPYKKKSKRKVAAVEPERKSKLKLIIIISIIAVVVIGLAAVGFIFRESIGNLFGSLFGSEPEADDYWDNYEYSRAEEETEDNGEGEAEEDEPDSVPITRLSYADLVYNWTLFYPESLTIVDTEPVDTWDYARMPSDDNTRILYWSEANNDGYAGAADFAEADPDGIFGTAEDFRVLNDNVIIALFDGDLYSSARFWYIDPDGIAYADISVETPESADEWYAAIATGEIYIEKALTEEE